MFGVYMNLRFVIGLLLVFSLNLINAQEINIEDVLSEELIEEILNETDGSIDFTTLMSDLSAYINSPININTATADELHGLHLLNDFQIHSLLEYRKENGNILSVFELQYIYGFDKKIIKSILPFISFKENLEEDLSLKNALKYGKHRVFVRSQKIIQEQLGYSSISDSLLQLSPNSRYSGSQYKIYARYQYQCQKKLSFGFTTENDPGEELFAGSNSKGFDFYSAHLKINDIGRFKTIALGDYHAKFGQGLAFWSGVAFGKSSNVMLAKKYSEGIKKYSSVDENQFLRGVSTTIDLGKFDISLFYSVKQIDGNISKYDSIAERPLEFSSFQQTGYHRTSSEISDEDAIRESVLGTHVDYRTGNFKIGATAVNFQYDANMTSSSDLYKLYSFQDNQASLFSLDYDWHKKNFNFFGETSYNVNGSYATLNGLQTNLLSDASLSIIYRDYSKEYFSPYSNALAEGSGTSNEKGVMSGIEIKSFKNIKISAYYDQFLFPWLTFNASSPSKGYEYLFQINYYINDQFEAYVQYKNENKEVDYTSEMNNLAMLTNREKTRMRFHFSYFVIPQIKFQNRIEYSLYSLQDIKEKGFMTYQDISWRKKLSPLSFSLRYIIFDTDSYNSRIYLYENDLLYTFSFPSMYDKGTRTYFLLKYNPNSLISFQIKYGITIYSDKEVISSGLNEISGNKKSELKAQLVMKF